MEDRGLEYFLTGNLNEILVVLIVVVIAYLLYKKKEKQVRGKRAPRKKTNKTVIKETKILTINKPEYEEN